MKKIAVFFLFLLVIAPVSADYPDFTGLIEQNSSSVVKINTTAVISAGGRMQIPDYDQIPEIFRDFFDQYRGRQREAHGIGSGFVISRDGYIVTNNHVVDQADKITVRLIDRREFPAEVVGVDQRSDLALLKVDADDLRPIKFAKPNQVRVGEWVVAIGSPFNLDYSASVGIISAIGRSLPTEKGENYVPFLQSDVAINPGNSGGPLFNMSGEVVGVNSQIYTRSGGSIGLSFSIPVSVVLEVVDQLKSKGHVDRGWLGVYIQDVNRDLALSLGLKKPQGALVAQVEPDSPADKAGIVAGDVIISINGKAIVESGDLPHTVGLIAPDTTVDAVLIREGKKKSLDVTIGQLPGHEEVASHSPDEGDRLGLEIRELDANSARNWRLPGGVVITKIFPDTAAETAGLLPGDVIVQLGYSAIRDESDYYDVLKGLPTGTPIAIRFVRKGMSVFRTIELE